MQDKVQETVDLLKTKGYEAVGQACNVGKLEDIKAIVKLAVDTYGRIDVLISNAAVNPAAGGILEVPDWAIDKLLGVNIKSPIQLVREVLPHMSKASSSSPHNCNTVSTTANWLAFTSSFTKHGYLCAGKQVKIFCCTWPWYVPCQLNIKSEYCREAV